MKYLIVLGFLLCAGCGIVDVLTTADPNEAQLSAAQAEIDAVTGVGQGTAAVGAATGNPAVVGVGVLVATIGGALGAIVKGKKDGKS